MVDNIIEIKATNSTETARKTGNNPVYILTIEDPSIKGKVAYFLAVRFTPTQSFIDVYGFNVEKEQIEKITKTTDIDAIANSNKKLNM